MHAQVVRPQLESADDALEREKQQVQRILRIIAQLQSQQQHKPSLACPKADATAALPLPDSSPNMSSEKENTLDFNTDVHGKGGGSAEVVQTGAQDWGLVENSTCEDAVGQAQAGLGTPFKSENVLKRLSELRSSILRPPR